jgi:hypothetical protein
MGIYPNIGADFWDAYGSGQRARQANFEYDQEVRMNQDAQGVAAEIAAADANQQQNPQAQASTTQIDTTSDGGYGQPAATVSPPTQSTAPVAPVISQPLTSLPKTTQASTAGAGTGKQGSSTGTEIWTPASISADMDKDLTTVGSSAIPLATASVTPPLGQPQPQSTTPPSSDEQPTPESLSSPPQRMPGDPAPGQALPTNPPAQPSQPGQPPQQPGMYQTAGAASALPGQPQGAPLSQGPDAAAPDVPNQQYPAPQAADTPQMRQARAQGMLQPGATMTQAPAQQGMTYPAPAAGDSVPLQQDRARGMLQPGATMLPPSTNQIAQPVQPAQPTPSASIGSKILGALNPVGTAYADEPKGSLPPGTRVLPPAKTDDGSDAKSSDGLIDGPGVYHPEKIVTGAIGAAKSALNWLEGANKEPQDASPKDAAADAPAPAKQAATANTASAPAAKGAITAPGGTTTTEPAPAAKVTPDQKGPSVASEAPVAYPTPGVDGRPWAAVNDRAPRVAQTIDAIAHKYNVPPDMLAANWNVESGMALSGDDPTKVVLGSNGQPIRNYNANGTTDMGPFQINSATRDSIDPKHEINPDTVAGGAELAARYYNTPAVAGLDPFLKAVAYNGGPGAAAAVAKGDFSNPATQHAYDYALKVFNGDAPKNFAPPVQTPSADAIAAAAQKEGPNGVIRMLAQANPNIPLTRTWTASETNLMADFLSKGDVNSAMQVRDMVYQIQHQGMSENLRGAYGALQAGDGVSAAQFLAKAHAFMPDGTMGRFGVDDKGQVWAERLDENTGKPIGKAFQITPGAVASMMIQTRDPNKALQLMDQHAQSAAQTSFYQQHGNYLGDMVEARREATRAKYAESLARNATSQSNATTRADATIDAAAIRSGKGALGSNGVPADQKTINAELGKPAITPTVAAIGDPTQNAAARAVFGDLRGMNGKGTQEADFVAGHLYSGGYHMRMNPQDGSGILVDKNGQTVAHLSPGTSRMLAQTMKLAAPPRRALPAPTIGHPSSPGFQQANNSALN